MSATLGGLIKDYRMSKNIQQIDVAYKMGWKDSSLVSRIEQGVVKRPKKSTILKLIKALKLEDEEKNTLLVEGGYQPDNNEIAELLVKLSPVIEKWKYPANVYDFSWRFLGSNKICSNLYGDNSFKPLVDNTKYTNILKINFDPDFYLSNFYMQCNKENKFLSNNILQFLRENAKHKETRWYKDLMKDLMQYEAFRTLYKDIGNIEEIGLTQGYSIETMYPFNNPNQKLTFYLFNQFLIDDPRFAIEYFVPANDQTYRYFNK